MQNTPLIFHLPIHYLPKIALRLEYLLSTLLQARTQSHPIIHHYAIKNIIKIIKIAEKPELKGRFLKEFIRIEHKLKKEEKDNIENEKLLQQIQILSDATGRFGESVHSDPFIQSVRVAQATEHDDTEFNCPQLLYWLSDNHEKRHQDIERWLIQFNSLFDTIFIYLSILRALASTQQIEINRGFHQYPINEQKFCQLISITIDNESNIVPKMQLGHHGLSLRLYNASSMQEMNQVNTTIKLAISNL